MNQDRFVFLGKTGRVVDLLRHLPYIPRGDEDRHIYEHTVCADYTHECVDRKEKHHRLSITDYFEPTDGVKENLEWGEFKERHEHVAVLGVPEVVSVFDPAGHLWEPASSSANALSLINREIKVVSFSLTRWTAKSRLRTL